ncbi:cobyrinate a,c-diamide synthase [Calothrix sp. FACHB-1219]|uniref:cobyrinate a,c-diamide synthase n=1 Tax=unclassified Calothrix TaxID=2619626 RepID=UPI0016876365|nr:MULTISPECIES: cobyrinate a,c-diamide synthase [unclassified Calothrix]MBD2203680.1 cobyrinate a,c-diamide synthase [Calothrix sp. FACHB-168]MBD2219986.1 cobyrinate a,c-diamide synthase [Calothrix sp. FACHB-1219]
MALVIAGERSGVGKTTVTLTLLASLCRRAIAVQSFKVGPDYIDPMFHQHVTGLACRNLDPVLTSEAYVQSCFTTYSQKSQYALIEGVMGLFDGISSNDKIPITDFASTAHIARLLNLPVVLVIDCSRLSGSVAAIAHGYCTFDPNIKIAGLVLNRVGSDRHLDLLKNALEPLNLPIIGVIRRQDDITIPDRHLGLVPTAELPELDAVINRLADLGDSCFDWERLLPLLRSGDEGETQFKIQNSKFKIEECLSLSGKAVVRVAVARDRAFNFYYQDNLDLLQKLGAELVFWSPLADSELPENVQGIYFGGGFPEVFAQQLSENISLRKSVKNAILQGIPTIAECGGLMYLCEQIIDFAGESWPMLGILPTSAEMGGRLTLGYRRAVALQDSLLINYGTNIYGHEFHRSRLKIPPNQPLFETYRYDCAENMGDEGWNLPANIHASYIHLHWGATVEIPQQFIQKCLEFKTIAVDC